MMSAQIHPDEFQYFGYVLHPDIWGHDWFFWLGPMAAFNLFENRRSLGRLALISITALLTGIYCVMQPNSTGDKGSLKT